MRNKGVIVRQIRPKTGKTRSRLEVQIIRNLALRCGVMMNLEIRGLAQRIELGKADAVSYGRSISVFKKKSTIICDYRIVEVTFGYQVRQIARPQPPNSAQSVLPAQRTSNGDP